MKKLKDISKKQWGLISTSIGSFLIIVGLLAMVGIGSGDTYAITYCTCPSGFTRSGSTCKSTSTITCCLGGNCNGHTTCSSYYQDCGAQYTDSDGSVLKDCSSPLTANCTCSKGTLTTSGTCLIETDDTITLTATFGGQTASCKANSGDSCLVTVPSGSDQDGKKFLGWSKSTSCSGIVTGGTVAISSNVTYYACYRLTATFGGQTASCTTTSGGSCLVNVPSGSNESGKTFLGWSKTTSCGGIVIGGTVSISQNTTYYPCYKSSNNNSGGEPCYTAAFQVDGSVVNTITGKRNADDGGCEVTAPSYTCSSGSFKGWFTNPTVCNQDVSGTGAGNILTLNSNKTYYGCCYKKSGDSGNPGGDSGNPGGDSGNPGGDSGNPGGDSGNSSGNSGNSGGNSGNSGGGLGNADGGNNSSNVNNNPSTATKAPLVIALMGVMSLAFGVFTYWKNRKVTDM